MLCDAKVPGCCTRSKPLAYFFFHYICHPLLITDDCEITYAVSLVSKQGSKMRFKIKELEEKLCYATQKYKDAEQKVSL